MSGKEALAICERAECDLVLLDVDLFVARSQAFVS
jgi:hypothetical protein